MEAILKSPERIEKILSDENDDEHSEVHCSNVVDHEWVRKLFQNE